MVLYPNKLPESERVCSGICIPEYGQVGIICITDKQFGEIELFYGKKASGVKTPGQQLELF